jgi:hypothetical protein
VFALDSKGKTEIAERVEIDLDAVDSDQEIAVIDAPQLDEPTEVIESLT